MKSDSSQGANTLLPLSVKTLSGSYLVSQHAQLMNDWGTASQYFNKVMGESPFVVGEQKDLFETRAMILNLGAGRMQEARFYAENFRRKMV